MQGPSSVHRIQAGLNHHVKAPALMTRPPLRELNGFLPDSTQITTAVARTWGVIFGYQPDAIIEQRPCEAALIAGQIAVTGRYCLIFTFRCCHTLARIVASAMFQRQPDDLTPDEVRDVIGELTNVIAGQIKSTLVGSYSMSTPVVQDYSAVIAHRPERCLLQQVHFCCDGHSLGLEIWNVSHTAPEAAEPSRSATA